MMSDPPLWARTDDQIRLVHTARAEGGLCAACGRRLDPQETVFFERFAVGPRRSWKGTRQPQKRAPVSAECASTGLLAHAEAADPPSCAGCGRGVVYPGARRSRRWVGCSLRCVARASASAHQRPTRTSAREAAVVERWNERLRRYREARGLSRDELAAACNRLGRRTERNDIVRYEEGAYWPRLLTFAALARSLGVSMDVLMWGEEEAARIAEERDDAPP